MRDSERRRTEQVANAGCNYAQARLLREKVSEGLISHQQLALAAHLGSETAGIVVDDLTREQMMPKEKWSIASLCNKVLDFFTGVPLSGQASESNAWFNSLRICENAQERAAIATARRLGFSRDGAYRENVSELIDWCLDIIEDTEEVVLGRQELVEHRVRVVDRETYMFLAAQLPGLYRLYNITVFLLYRVQWSKKGGGILALANDILSVSHAGGIHQEIAIGELLPWALGEKDPVRERVQSRRERLRQFEARNELLELLRINPPSPSVTEVNPEHDQDTNF